MVNEYYKSSFVEFLCSNNKTWSNEEQRWCPQNTKNLKIKMISIHLIMIEEGSSNNVGYYEIIDG